MFRVEDSVARTYYLAGAQEIGGILDEGVPVEPSALGVFVRGVH